MKIVSTSGCTCDSLTINDIETINIKAENLQAVIKVLIDRETDVGVLQDILRDLVTNLGEFKDLGHCETCGDYIDQYTLEV